MNTSPRGGTLCAALALLLAGCALHTPPPDPQLKLPAQWKMAGPASAATSAGDRRPWWEEFDDARLSALVGEALRVNNSLAAAILRVQRARLQAGLADTSITPAVTAGANFSEEKIVGSPGTSRFFNFSGTLSYEVDLWGRLASQRDAAAWDAQASLADCQAAALSLIGTTATSYWQLALNNQQIAIGERNLSDAEKVLAMVRTKYAAGAVSGLDIAQAEQNLAALQADQTQLLQQRIETRNALTILFDQAPETSIADDAVLAQETLPDVDPDLPASLLGHRPELHADELRLRESLANLDATKASFYPAFSLNGSYGRNSDPVTLALQNPVLTLGAGLTLPFIQWNTTQLTIKVSENQYAEAVANFRQHLYSALSEVEDALSARAQYDAQAEKLELSLRQAKRAEAMTETRYRAGAISVQSWLDAQQKVRGAELALAQNRFNRLSTQVKLNKALGRGVEYTCVAAAKGQGS